MALYDKMKPVVVLFELYYENEKRWDSEGTGVFVSPQGHVLTLSHLFNEDPNAILRIVTVGGDKYDCYIVDVDPSSGFALLQVKIQNKNFCYAEIHMGDLDIGKKIYSIGHSFFLDYSYGSGEISFPLRRYGEVLDYIKEAKTYKSNKTTSSDPSENYLCHVDDLTSSDPSEKYLCHDPSEKYLCHVDDLTKLKLKPSVSLVQVNNIHGDGMGGSSGMPLFDSLGYIIGIYAFAAHDQCYGIHAKCVRSYLKKKLKIFGHGQASTSGS